MAPLNRQPLQLLLIVGLSVALATPSWGIHSHSIARRLMTGKQTYLDTCDKQLPCYNVTVPENFSPCLNETGDVLPAPGTELNSTTAICVTFNPACIKTEGFSNACARFGESDSDYTKHEPFSGASAPLCAPAYKMTLNGKEVWRAVFYLKDSSSCDASRPLGDVTSLPESANGPTDSSLQSQCGPAAGSGLPSCGGNDKACAWEFFYSPPPCRPPREDLDTETEIEYVKVKNETAYGLGVFEAGTGANGDFCSVEEIDANRWGWSMNLTVPESEYLTVQLMAGAGNCDMEAGEWAGNLTLKVTHDSGSATVTAVSFASDLADSLFWRIEHLHIWLGNLGSWPRKKNGDINLASGDFTLNSAAVNVTSSFSGGQYVQDFTVVQPPISATVPIATLPQLHMIVHTEAFQYQEVQVVGPDGVQEEGL